jgi:selenide,water dikinase
LPAVRDDRVLAGVGEDACVYRLGDDLAVVETVDFITPVVDDPRAFGAVAAANALSDVYAMGARPLFALNVVAYPVRTLPLAGLEAILAGGAEKAAEAGVPVLGGHTVDDPTPKYGLAVTGLVDPARVVRKAGARPGDRLVLTKPLGIGVLTTALDRGLAGRDVEDRVLPVMAQLNRAAAEAMQVVGVHACTDVTGFGLLGHLREVAERSGVAARIHLGRVPVLEEAWALVAEGAVSQGTQNNYRYLRDRVAWDPAVPREGRLILCDAQTSGGLLMAVPPPKVDALLAALAAGGCRAADVGEVVEGPAGHVAVLA